MTKYFEHFPEISYNGVKVKDITRRATFKRELLSNPYLYMPYTIKDNERAEDIAHWYYGSTDYVWLVYYANNIVDPYMQWPLSDYNFNQYLVTKYGEISGRVGEDVVDWARDPGNDENVLYYYKEV